MLVRESVQVQTHFLHSRTSPRHVFNECMELRRKIHDFRPHLLHAQYGTMNAFIAALAGLSIPLVITFRGSDLNPVPSFGRVRTFLGHLLSQLAAARASATICVSPELHRRLWWRLDRSQIIVGGVNTDLFIPIEREIARRKLGWAKLGLNEASPVVLFNAGRYPRVKRLDLAEAAVRRAQQIRPEIRMVTLRGDVEPDLMPLYYSAADCLLVTSDWEGSPTVVKEALACALPIVSVDVGDVAERLRRVEPSQITGRGPNEIAEALCKILAAPRRSNGRQAVTDLSEQMEVKRIRSLYDSVMHGIGERG
ncbi:MAG: glycosyltransferase [Acidobacteriota bacterium]|nr:glycosyltransferase [Acidobacteriota bacterium]